MLGIFAIAMGWIVGMACLSRLLCRWPPWLRFHGWVHGPLLIAWAGVFVTGLFQDGLALLVTLFYSILGLLGWLAFWMPTFAWKQKYGVPTATPREPVRPKQLEDAFTLPKTPATLRLRFSMIRWWRTGRFLLAMGGLALFGIAVPWFFFGMPREFQPGPTWLWISVCTGACLLALLQIEAVRREYATPVQPEIAYWKEPDILVFYQVYFARRTDSPILRDALARRKNRLARRDDVCEARYFPNHKTPGRSVTRVGFEDGYFRIMDQECEGLHRLRSLFRKTPVDLRKAVADFKSTLAFGIFSFLIMVAYLLWISFGAE